VVRHPGQDADRADLAGHPGRHRAEQLVVRRAVVGDRLGDALQVDQQDGRLPRLAAGGDRVGTLVHERGVGKQPGDLVPRVLPGVRRG
jgi:hypothetical protein